MTVQVFLDGFFVEAHFALDGASGGGVNVATTSCHHDALERRVAHGCIVRITVFDRSERSARTEVASDDARLENFGIAHIVTDSAHGEAVITITLNLGAVSQLSVDRVIFMNIIASVMEM